MMSATSAFVYWAAMCAILAGCHFVIGYAAVVRRSKAAGLIWPSVEWRRRWL